MDNLLEIRLEILADSTIDPYVIMEQIEDQAYKVEGVIEVDAADVKKLGEWSWETGDVLNG